MKGYKGGHRRQHKKIIPQPMQQKIIYGKMLQQKQYCLGKGSFMPMPINGLMLQASTAIKHCKNSGMAVLKSYKSS
jgi:hypothetical protein